LSIRKIILLSFVIRCIIAAAIELGNDEVYYTTYAAFPDWSHFDHPPMVGWVIQLFSLDLWLRHEFFIRLGAVFFGTVNTWLMYVIGKNIKDERTGTYAALLYNASIYCSIIAGTFILPDSPQLTFWLAAIFFMLRIIENQRSIDYFLLSSCVGLAMLSKYHSLYLWGALGLFFLLFERRRLLDGRLWAAGIFSIVLFSPVIYWNIQHDWISFTFHENRIEPLGLRIDFNTFGQFFGGQILYQNPINCYLIVAALVAWRKNHFLEERKFWLLGCIGVPLIALFTFVSLFRATLPHWSGPGFLSLLLIAAAFLSEKAMQQSKFFIPKTIKASLCLIFCVVIIGVAQIRLGIFDLGKNDPSLDMYGWKQLAQKVMPIIENDAAQRGIPSDEITLISNKWFPAAHLDFYIATPHHKKLIVLGDISDIHKYAWINLKRGKNAKKYDAYLISLSTQPTNVAALCGSYFEDIFLVGETSIFRETKSEKMVLVYRVSPRTGQGDATISW
jgi:hypothetical protein